MKIEKEEKKTLWGRFTSWLVEIFSAIKKLFSSKNASKATTAKPNVVTPEQSEGKGMEAVQQVTTEPAVEMPQLEPQAVVDEGELKVNGTQQHQRVGFINSDLELVVHDKYKSLVENSRNIDVIGEGLIHIMVNGKAHCITYKDWSLNQDKSLLVVNSMRNQGGEYTSACFNVEVIKDLLGLNGTTTAVEITEISKDLIESKVESPTSAANGNTPSSETVDLKVQQQVADNGQSVPKVGNSK